MGEPASVPSAAVSTVPIPFEDFFEVEYPRLSEALVLLTGDPFEAEELAQEAMTRVLERWDRVSAMDSPTGYLFRTAMNLHRNRVRRILARARRAFHEEATAPDHGSTVSDQQDVRLAIAKLSRAEREALILVDWQQLDAAEAAGLLGISASAVRVRLHRARTALRHHLGETNDD
jgi:RNA polymerase sigma-70 factor (ECF subfamily)